MRFGWFAIALVSFSLFGCATPMVWEKSGVSQADFKRDRYECERDMRQSGYFGGGISGSINRREFFKSCMGARGYTLRADPEK